MSFYFSIKSIFLIRDTICPFLKTLQFQLVLGPRHTRILDTQYYDILEKKIFLDISVRQVSLDFIFFWKFNVNILTKKLSFHPNIFHHDIFLPKYCLLKFQCDKGGLGKTNLSLFHLNNETILLSKESTKLSSKSLTTSSKMVGFQNFFVCTIGTSQLQRSMGKYLYFVALPVI